MKKYYIILLLSICCFTIQAQDYYKKDNNEFTETKITVLNSSNDAVTIKVYYESSQRCMCEESETIEMHRNDSNEFVYPILENPDNTIKVIFQDGKVFSILVTNAEDYNCCSITSGEYFLKPE